MLQSTPMLSRQDSADARACQSDAHIPPFPRAQKVIAAVVRAYRDAYPAATVTPDAILGPSRAVDIARARHLCAYLGCDEALDDLLSRARAALAGRVDDARLQVRCDETRRRGREETSPREWDEYRYWRLRALRSPRYGATGGA